jgi:hypothetical protein
VPLAQDLFADSKFQAHCAQHGKDPWDEALSLCHQPGNILQDRGIIASKPPGHLSVFLHYIYFRLQEELSRGIDVAYFHIGEDAAGIPDVRLLAHAKANNAVAYVGVVKSYMPQSGGYLISNDGRLQLHEGGDIGITAPFYLNTCRIAINLPALACFLASDVEAFMGLDEFHIRRAVQQKILDMLIPRVEIKPLNNYTLWAGQFAYVLGQISEAVPTEFILCDEPFPELLTFKTREELANILPVIEQAYAPYLNYLELHSDRT